MRRATLGQSPFLASRHYFYPRSPCGERLITAGAGTMISPFLSTLSLRRATTPPAAACDANTFLSTLSLRRATGHLSLRCTHRLISIHALLAESDGTISDGLYPATAISIHALLAESDCSTSDKCRRRKHFYPRSPCGERHNMEMRMICTSIFLSTLSLRRATKYHQILLQHNAFLSTLSLRRATSCSVKSCSVK